MLSLNISLEKKPGFSNDPIHSVIAFNWNILTQGTECAIQNELSKVGSILTAKLWDYTSTYTHGHNIPHSWFSEKHFNSFDSLPIGIKKQMISHLKALVKSFENQE